MTAVLQPIEPRPRPSRLHGFTEVIQTGDGKLYATLNYDGHGLREVFLTIGRSGGTIASLAEAIGREVSVMLQYGIPVEEIARCLVGIRSANVSPDQKWLSIADALGHLIKHAPTAGKDTSQGETGVLP